MFVDFFLILSFSSKQKILTLKIKSPFSSVKVAVIKISPFWMPNNATSGNKLEFIIKFLIPISLTGKYGHSWIRFDDDFSTKDMAILINGGKLANEEQYSVVML